MKRINLLILSLILSIYTFSQDYPGKDVELLVGKEIQVKEQPETLQMYGYDDFYIKEDLKKKYACCEHYNSKYSSLVGKIFKVLSVELYTNSIGIDKIKLKIENEETGIIYFNHDPSFKREDDFPFIIIGGLDFPEGYFCKDIEESKDKFTGEITYSSPTDYITFSKVKSDNETNTYMSIREVVGSTLNTNETGVIILFDNGSKLERPDAEIDVEVSNYRDRWDYSAFFNLSDSDIKLLSENIITDVRLYIYDSTIANGKKLADYMKCISKR
jgi:hypothetical protein